MLKINPGILTISQIGFIQGGYAMGILQKKACAIVVAFCLLFVTTTSTFASSAESTLAYEQYDVASILCDGKTLEVPVLRQVIYPRSGEGTVSSTETIFVPDMTEETLARNESIIDQIKNYGSPSVSRGYGDFYERGYIAFHSTLNYATHFWYANETATTYTPLFRLLSFRLDREVHTYSPFRALHKADAKAMQIGTAGDPADPAQIFSQTKIFSQIEYGALNLISENWVPVGYIPDGPYIGIVYTICISYIGRPDFVLEYVHQAV